MTTQPETKTDTLQTTADGALLYGVEYHDGLHSIFTVRLPMVRDTISALSATQAALGTVTGSAATMYYKVAVMASALVSLGEIPKDALSAELLLDTLVDDDFDLIDSAINDLKKKRLNWNADL